MAIIVLTDTCNLACQDCLRPVQPSRGQTKPWSFRELDECLDELAEVGHSFVAFTGGEPTLWQDGKRGIADLLAAAGRKGFTPLFTTNGRAFRDYDTASSLLDRYFELTDARLQVAVSVDLWHEGAWVEGRSAALNTLLRWLEVNGERKLHLEVSSVWCLDDERNLPPEEFARYTEAEIKLHYLPLSPLGRAEGLRELSPQLCPEGACKSTLGSYGEVLRAKRGLSKAAWAALNNSELLGPCFAGDTITLDLDRRYWLCNDRAGDSMSVAPVGGLSAEAILDCLARNPVVAAFREFGILDTLRQSGAGAGPLPWDAAAAAISQCHPYGKSVRAACGLCRSLPRDIFS